MSTEPKSHSGAKLKKKERWQPKKWEPLYDSMVALSCTGLSNKAIADRFNYTPQQVCNILTSTQGKLIKTLVSKFIQEELRKSVTEKLAATERRAHDIVAVVLNDNELLAKNPLAMYDRAVKFLEGRGKLEDPAAKKQNVIERTFVVPSDIAAKLVEGMHKSNEAIMLHGGAEVRQLKTGTDNA